MFYLVQNKLGISHRIRVQHRSEQAVTRIWCVFPAFWFPHNVSWLAVNKGRVICAKRVFRVLAHGLDFHAVDVHLRFGGQPPSQRVQGMQSIFPREVSWMHMAQIFGDGHEVVRSSRLKVGLLLVQRQVNRRVFFAMQNHLKAAPIPTCCSTARFRIIRSLTSSIGNKLFTILWRHCQLPNDYETQCIIRYVPPSFITSYEVICLKLAETHGIRKRWKIIVLRKSHFSQNYISFSLILANVSQMFPILT